MLDRLHGHNTGVVDDNVEAPPASHGRLDEVAHILLGSYVGMEIVHLGAVSLQVRSCPSPNIIGNIGQHDRRAGSSEGMGDA